MAGREIEALAVEPALQPALDLARVLLRLAALATFGGARGGIGAGVVMVGTDRAVDTLGGRSVGRDRLQ